MLSWAKNKLRNWVIGNLIITSKPEDVFSIKNGVFMFGNEQMSHEEIKSMQEEIKFIEKTRVWTILVATLESDAQEKMFLKSTSFDDMWAGKMMLYNLSVVKNILRRIKSFAKK